MEEHTISVTPPAGKRKSRQIFVFALLVALGLAGVVWHWHGLWLARLVESGLKSALPALGFSLVQVEIEGGIGRPLRLRNLELGPPPCAPDSNATRLTVPEIEVTPAAVSELLWGQGKWIRRLAWSGVRGTLDYRSESFPPPEPLVALTPQQEDQLFPWVRRMLPASLEGNVEDLQVLADGQTYHLRELELAVREGRVGDIQIGGLELTWPGGDKVLPAARGRSIWRGGGLYLLGLPLGDGLEVTEFEISLLRRGGPGLRAEFAAFGGWARMDAAFPIEHSRQALEVSAWARKVDLAQLGEWAGLPGGLQGLVEEARLTFRGFPDEWSTGEAVGILRAGGVAWGPRRFDLLSAGLRLGERRLLLSEFLLLQGHNQVQAEGEVRLPKSGDWLKAEVTGQLRADLPDLGALSTLVGTDLTQAEGSLQATADATLRGGEPSARVRVSGSSLKWRGVEVGDLGAEVLLTPEAVEVREGWVKGKLLQLETTGTMQTRTPNVYAGALHLAMADLQVLDQWLPEGLVPSSMGGKLDVQWRGDGTRQRHSGAFEFKLEDFRTPEMLRPVSGEFAATYSPESWYFSKASLRQQDWNLTWTLSAGSAGLYVGNLLLQGGREKLLDGQIFLPWNPLSILQEGGWRSGMLPDKPYYVSLQSTELSLTRLGRLFGQELPVQGRGRLSLQGQGTISAPVLEGSMTWQDLRSTDAERREWVRRLETTFKASDGRLVCAGEALLPLVRPINWKVETPFGFRVDNGDLQWVEPTGELRGEILWPATPVTAFEPLLPTFHKLAGNLGAEIKLGGSWQSPQIEGTLQLREGLWQPQRQSPVLENLNLTCRFDGQSFQLEDTGGTIGAGPFAIRGGGNFADPAKPQVDLRITGDNLLLLRDRRTRLRTDLDVTLQGGLDGGALRGRIGLVDGRIFQKLEITPLLQAAASEVQPMPLLPALEGLVPPPLDRWVLDLQIENATPFLLIGNLASGEIIPEIRLGGTLGQPQPSGRIILRNLFAYLPFSVVNIPEGFIYLDPLNPRVPILDVRGSAEVLEYQITLIAQGPLDEGNLYARSDPPLSQEEILLLLTTGLAPGLQSGSGFGEAAIGQGGLLLLKTMARQFETGGVNTDSLINRVQITTQPGLTPGTRATMRGEFRLTDNLGIMAQRDGLGFLGAGLTYSIRFR